MKNYTLNDLMMVLDANLDSVTQQLLHPNPNIKKIQRQLHWCLCACRRITGGMIPLVNYTLTRCQNMDELPSFRHKGLPRSPARTDWHKFKAQEKARKEQSKLWKFWDGEIE